ncbi:helix-turn-helix domain-containing protein, partial [Inquilinus sp.]|jgi:AraC-like DNA-binding protein|uniref:helix-turn-helix domain-containing protein n=1 Tax=Inquilinus sp. TaxID=1932117 RepID=UPI003782FA40
MTYLFNGRRVTIGAGDFVFFWGAIPHQAIEVSSPASFVCLYLPIEMFLSATLGPRLKSAVLGGALVGDRSPLPFDAAQFEHWHAELNRGDERITALVRQEIEQRLRRSDLCGWEALSDTGDGAAAAEGRHAKVWAMAGFIAAHASEAISVSDVAASVCLHPNYAMAIFREALGLSIGGYLTRQRLYVAQALLLSTETDIVSIAFEAGFGSVSRFYEAFGRTFAMPPRQYRMLYRGGG